MKSQHYTLYIYVLICPLTLSPKYVGITHNPEARIAQIWHGSGPDTPLRRWIRSLRAEGCDRPQLIVIDHIRTWCGIGGTEREKFWIKRLSANLGKSLLNVSHGPHARKFRRDDSLDPANQELANR